MSGTGVNIYTSNDASAPQLTGSAGALTAILDACLVNGYGSKAAAGTTGSGAGAWAISFTATNKRVYRPTAGNRFYVRINDAAAGTGGAKEALVKGAESFSDVDTATAPIPSTGQSALTQNSLIIRKSATADAITGRPWIVAADDRTVLMFINAGDTANTYNGGFYWGDFCSEVSADGFRTTILGRSLENGTSSTNFALTDEGTTANIPGHFIQRTYDGTGVSIAVWKGVNLKSCPTSQVVWTGNIAYPNLAGAKFGIGPILLGEIAPFVRGRWRGLWYSPHTYASVNDGDTLTGTGALAGKTFRVVKGTTSGSFIVVETSDTWDTSS